MSMENSTSLVSLEHFERARHAIELAATIDEVKEIRDQAEALRLYARQSRQGLVMQNRCAEIKLRAERRGGEMLAVMPKSEGGDPSVAAASVAGASPYRQALVDNDLAERSAERWQAVASVPEARFEEYVKAPKGEELTTAGLLRQAHVSHNSGENEWYTPAEYIESARLVLGAIDLDPASSAAANEIVRATEFYTIEDDGLALGWHGRVWMNPPYAADLIGQFCARMVEQYASYAIDAAIVLVNNATETLWFQELAGAAAAICFPERRVRFWNPDGVPSSPLQGQAFVYLGDDVKTFAAEFRRYGLVLEPSDG